MELSLACPLQTQLPHSAQEECHPSKQCPEIRAYKLGKKRWSYNQVELVLGEAGGSGRTAVVHHMLRAGGAKFPEAHQESAVGFMVQLESGHKLQAHVYLCHGQQPAQLAAAVPAVAESGGRDSPAAEVACSHYAWQLVTRGDCCKGCQGPVLRSIQRFGRLGKRAWGSDIPKPPDAADRAAAHGKPSSLKDPRCMYLSLDEACTHVGASAFRLVAGIYNRQGTRLLTTAVSGPIRVLANNDVPTGAARIVLEASLPTDWEGWGSAAPAASPVAAGSEGAASPCLRRSSTTLLTPPVRSSKIKLRFVKGPGIKQASSGGGGGSSASVSAAGGSGGSTPRCQAEEGQYRFPCGQDSKRPAQYNHTCQQQYNEGQQQQNCDSLYKDPSPYVATPTRGSPAAGAAMRRPGSTSPAPCPMQPGEQQEAADGGYLEAACSWGSYSHSQGITCSGSPQQLLPAVACLPQLAAAAVHGSSARLAAAPTFPLPPPLPHPRHSLGYAPFGGSLVLPDSPAAGNAGRGSPAAPAQHVPAQHAVPAGVNADALREAERQLLLLWQFKAHLRAACRDRCCSALPFPGAVAPFPQDEEHYIGTDDRVSSSGGSGCEMLMEDNLGLPLLDNSSCDFEHLHLMLPAPEGLEPMHAPSIFDDLPDVA